MPKAHAGSSRKGGPAALSILALRGAVIALAPNLLAVSHWERLLRGAIYAASPRGDAVVAMMTGARARTRRRTASWAGSRRTRCGARAPASFESCRGNEVTSPGSSARGAYGFSPRRPRDARALVFGWHAGGRAAHRGARHGAASTPARGQDVRSAELRVVGSGARVRGVRGRGGDASAGGDRAGGSAPDA